MTEADPQPRVDPEHPWPALLSFREDDRRYFGGRKDEVEALYRRIGASRLTLLFGLSGLGKTSLLRAGLFPRLRLEHYFPVYIRLRYGRDLPSPVEQIKSEIVAQARAFRIEAPEPRDGETLWQYFHRPDADFWDQRNYPTTPVLVFDQFEELFTKSREVAEQANELIEELADLAEGASPALLREAAERDRSLLRQVYEDRYRLVIGIRSDYLAQLQGISDRVRAVFANRYELHRMSGAAALKSTLTAGGHLMDEEVARRVVRFVAGARESESLSVESLEVEPALLSLVCSELNATRIARGEAAITASMLSGSKDEILSRFYEASFADVAPELRVLVEDKLVTRDGRARNFISEQTARETAGVTDEDLGKLVHRRLLRFEESGSSRRMELTHDLLTAVAAASRANREHRLQIEEAQRARAEAEQREAAARRALRRSRAAMLVFFVLLAAAVAGPFVAARWTASGAKKIEADFFFDLALQKLSSDEPSEGLAYLARAARLDRGNGAARTLLYEQLLTRSWPVPLRAFGPRVRISDAAISPDGARVAFRFGRTISAWDVATGRRIRVVGIGFEPRHVRFAHDGWTVLFDPGYGSGAADRAVWWDVREDLPKTFADFRKLPGAQRCSDLQLFDVSPSGKELAIRCDRHPVILTAGTGRSEDLWTTDLGDNTRSAEFAPNPRFLVAEDSYFRSVLLERNRPGFVRRLESGELLSGFSGDGRRVAVLNPSLKQVEMHDLESWASAGKLEYTSPPQWAVLDRFGSTLITFMGDDTIDLGNVETNSISFGVLRDPRILAAGFTAEGARFFTASDTAVRWWSAHDGAALSEPILQSKMVAAQLDRHGNLVTVAKDARVWQFVSPVLPPALPEIVAFEEFTDDRRTVIGSDEQGTMAGWDPVSGSRRWTEPANVSILAIDPAGSHAVVRDERALSLVDMRTWKPRWTRPGRGFDAVFSGDGTVLVLDGVALSVATGAPLALPADAAGQILLEISHDGSLFAFRQPPGLVVWDVRKRRVVLRISTTDPVDSEQVAFSPGGRQIVVLSPHTLEVWELADGSSRLAEPEAEGSLAEVVFSPDGRSMAVRSDKAVLLCDTRTLECAENHALRHEELIGVEFSADGSRVLTVSTGEVRVWDVATKRPLSLGLPWEKFTGLSADGMTLYAVNEGELYRVPLPSLDDEEAARLADLAEALAGLRVERLGTNEEVNGVQALADLEKRCDGNSGPACGIVRWLRTAPERRTVSPLSGLSAAAYVQRRLKVADDATEERQRLHALFPGEPSLRP